MLPRYSRWPEMTADVEVDCVKLCVNNACAVDCRGRGQMTRKPRQCRLNHSSRGINRHGGGPAVVLDGVYLDDSGHATKYPSNQHTPSLNTFTLAAFDVPKSEP